MKVQLYTNLINCRRYMGPSPGKFNQTIIFVFVDIHYKAHSIKGIEQTRLLFQ